MTLFLWLCLVLGKKVREKKVKGKKYDFLVI